MLTGEINLRDPFILPFGNKYYMYGTEVSLGGYLSVYTSEDLINWTEPKVIFERPSVFPADSVFLSPEVYNINDKFYLFFTLSSNQLKNSIWVLHSDKPDADFTLYSETALTPTDKKCVGPTLYFDKKGSPHLVFCYEWSQVGDGEVCEIRLSDDLKSAVGKPRTLWRASQYKDIYQLSDGKSYVADGPFLFKRNNGELYSIWSSITVGNKYSLLLAKSDNGEISGNWSPLDEPLDISSGHAMIFNDFSDNRLLVMHSPNVYLAEKPVFYDLIDRDGEEIYITRK